MNHKQIRQLLKGLKTKVQNLKLERLLSLDYSDRSILEQELTELNQRLNYLIHWQGAQCSVVLEACGIFKYRRNHDPNTSLRT